MLQFISYLVRLTVAMTSLQPVAYLGFQKEGGDTSR